MKRQSKRKTIGILIDWTVDSYQQMFLGGVLDFAREHDLNCLCFEGGALHSPHEYEAERNALYDLVGKENVDGLVALSASLSMFTSPEVFTVFCERFADLPVVSVALKIPSLPSVLVDNTLGLRELILHLLDTHGARRFAFIQGQAGNNDAAERYRTFLDTLGARGIEVDPRLVFQGDFLSGSGIAAVEYFCEQGIEGIDAIVAANDAMALGALEELSRRDPALGARIIVTGFDDLDLASYSQPSLTTVRLPIYEQGRTSAKLLYDRMMGREVPRETVLPTIPVIRQSCHCLPVRFPENEAAPGVGRPHRSPAAETRAPVNQGAQRLAQELNESLRRGLGEGGEKGFIAACGEIARRSSASGFDFPILQNLLYGLWSTRHQSGRAMSPHALDACFHAVMDLGQTLIQNEWERIQGFSQESRSLQMIREILSIHDTKHQMDLLAFRLGDVGVANCAIALYEHDSAQAAAILGLKHGKRINEDLAAPTFPASRLAPDVFWDDAEPRCFIVKSLKRFGFILFELDSRRLRFFSFLGDIIGVALETARLFQELEEQKNGISHHLDHLRHAMSGFIQAMSLTVETRDPYTAGHQRRVSDLARNIAQLMDLPPAQVESIRMAGLIHDIGKIYVSSEILNRSGRLDEVEYNLVKKHPQVAYEILKNVDFPWPVAEIVYQHHERLDGSGYPRGLSGAAIGLEARILAVADVVEAMASHRPYRGALGVDEALAEVAAHRGTLYDPAAVDACLRLFHEKQYHFRK